jgi:hypothetical protein
MKMAQQLVRLPNNIIRSSDQHVRYILILEGRCVTVRSPCSCSHSQILSPTYVHEHIKSIDITCIAKASQVSMQRGILEPSTAVEAETLRQAYPKGMGC